MSHRRHFKREAPRKSDHKTQRKPQKVAQMGVEPLGAVQIPMFSRVAASQHLVELQGGCWLAAGWLQAGCWVAGWMAGRLEAQDSE